jgi:glycosyltransferase involved in cell wall biosynthesis
MLNSIVGVGGRIINKFTSRNTIPWWRWIFSKSSEFTALTFFFLSRKNSTSPRFFPLFNEMESLHIVLVRGTRWGKLDYFQLKAINFLEKITRKKQRNYNWLLTSKYVEKSKFGINLVLNLDDPLYSEVEINNIRSWEKKLIDESKRGVIIVTSETTKSYLNGSGVESPIFVIEQGYTNNTLLSPDKNKNFSLVYSSPYIDSKNDKHGDHPTWGVDLFIKEIIPKIIRADGSIEIHLVGRIGKEANRYLKDFNQVKLHGLVTFSDNSKILKKAHLGLYPRKFDNNRRVQKIYEYIGANLPIVTFDLEDTKPVIQLGVGISVNSVDEFVNAVIKLKNDHELYISFYSKILKIQNDYSWQTLASRFDKLIYDSFPSV